MGRLPLQLLLLFVIVCSVYSCSASSCTEAWITAIPSNSSGTGAYADPFTSFEAVQRWLTLCLDSPAILHFYPGQYSYERLNTTYSITLQQCLNCTSVSGAQEVVLKGNQPLFTRASQTSAIVLANLTFDGSNLPPDFSGLPLIQFSQDARVSILNVTIKNMRRSSAILQSDVLDSPPRGSLHIDGLQALNNVFSVLDAEEHAVGVILTASPTVIRNGVFVRNRVRSVFRTLYATTSILAYDLLSVVDSRFTQNHLGIFASKKRDGIPKVDQKERLFGGTVVSLGSSAHFQNCVFESNIAEDRSDQYIFVGGAISSSSGVSLAILNSHFFNNSADLGGAIAFAQTNNLPFTVPFDLAMRQVFIRNVSVIENRCTLRGCGLLFEPLWSVSIHISQSVISNNVLSTQHRHWNAGELVAGSGFGFYSFEDPFILPFYSIIVLEQVDLFENVVSESAQSFFGDGASFSALGADSITIYACKLAGHSLIHFGVLWVQNFHSFTMTGSQVYNNAVDESVIGVSVIQIAQDKEYVERRRLTPASVVLSYVTSYNNSAGTIFDITDVETAIIEHCTVLRSAPSQIAESFALSVSAVHTSVRLVQWTSFESKEILQFSGITRLEIDNCNFTSGMMSGSSVVISTVPDLLISNSSWVRNKAIALTVAYSTLNMYNCMFEANNGATSGAITLDNTLATIADSRFHRNIGVKGGAINANSDLTIISCTFDGNHALSGGAVFVTTADLLFYHSECTNNLVTGEGGCIFAEFYLTEKRSIQLLIGNNSLFESNFAMGKGGAVSAFSTPTRWLNCSFIANYGARSGGALALTESVHHVIRSTFFENSAGSYNLGPPVELTLLQLATSLSTSVQSLSSSLHSGGAIYATKAIVSLSRSRFERNIAQLNGGAVFLDDTAFSISSVTFERNGALSVAGALAVQGEFSTDSRHDSIARTTFSNNYAAFGGAISWDYKSKNLVSVSATTFEANLATLAGGAILAGGKSGGAFFTYKNVTYIRNYAPLAGATFFYRASNSSKSKTPIFCDVDLNCVIIRETNKAPLWGLVWASTGLAASISHSNPISNASNAISTRDSPLESQHPGDFHVFLDFTDRFGQTVPLSVPLGAVQVALQDQSRRGSISLVGSPSSYSERDTRVIIGVALNSSQFVMDSGARVTSNNPFSEPLIYEVALTLSAPSECDETLLQPTPIGSRLLIQGCEVGEGLIPFSTDPRWSRCTPCPVNTYNLNGNGQCYQCNETVSEAMALSCEGSLVRASEGLWVTSINRTNELFVGKCLRGYCMTGQCRPGRTGTLCGECVPGAYESFWSMCSSEVCAQPSVVTLTAFSIALVASFFLFHHFIFTWPIQTMTLLFILQMGWMTLQDFLDAAAPDFAAWTVAAPLCGLRLSPLQRQLLFTFAPYTLLPTLWIAALVSTALRRLFAPNAAPSTLSLARVSLTTLALCFAFSSPTLKFSLDWAYCQDTPSGMLWRSGPSVLCTSSEFIRAKFFGLLFGVPLIALALLPTSIYWAIYGRIIVSNVAEDDSFVSHLFHFLRRSRSLIWPLVEIGTRIIVPVILSTGMQAEIAQALTLSIVFVLVTLAQSFFSPFASTAHRLAANGATLCLCMLSMFRLVMAGSPSYPFVGVGLLLFASAGLLVVFVGARPDANDSIRGSFSVMPTATKLIFDDYDD